MQTSKMLCALCAITLQPMLSLATDVDVSILGTTAEPATTIITEEVMLGSAIVMPTSIPAVDVSATGGLDNTVYVSRDGGTVHAFYYVDLTGEPTAGLFSITSNVAGDTSDSSFLGFSPASFDILFEIPADKGGCSAGGGPVDCPTQYLIGDPEITLPLGCPHVVMCSIFPPDGGIGGDSIEEWGIGSSISPLLFDRSQGVGFMGNDGTPNQPTAISRFEITVPPLGELETSQEYLVAPQPDGLLTWVEEPDFGEPIIPGQIEGADTGTTGELTIHVIEGFVSSGDCDGDNDVDLVDFADLTLCFTGRGGQFTAPLCACADFDGDRDIDLGDFTQFQLQFTGAAPIN